MLILGAGINGCALARELLLNDVHVCLVDRADIASGTTAYSSRLIHGGLRYLEYGEFDLVRESLAERTRLLRLAPQFVQPLQLFIPVDNRFGGLASAVGRFLGMRRFASESHGSRRGAWLVRLGLWFYDTYARDPTLPRRAVHRTKEPGIVAVDRDKFRWLLSYYDAQILYPERFTLALVEDARRIAAGRGLRFDVLTYHQARLDKNRVMLTPVARALDAAAAENPTADLAPHAIVNATGAWVDHTLQTLGVPARRFIGGTKGSHFITHNVQLRDALDGKGIYAEAPDGRPVFILPFGQGVLVGTTDELFHGDPRDAVATDAELAYLRAAVNEIVPQADLKPDDIDLSYCGVRPLPYVEASSTAAITRRHWMAEVEGAGVPLYAIVGGKLTTCRSLAEQSAAAILKRLELPHVQNSRERPLPGAERYPSGQTERAERIRQWASRHGLTSEQVRAMCRLVGTQYEAAFADSVAGEAAAACTTAAQSFAAAACVNLTDTDLPLRFVEHVIRHEWVTTLDDLVERRLMLVFQPKLSAACLAQLAQLLAANGKLPAEAIAREVDGTIQRLQNHFRKHVRTDLGQCSPTAVLR